MESISTQQIETKYPKSKKGFQCISPCYKQNTIAVHPITMEYITENYPFCAVNEWADIDPVTGKKINKISDKCINPTHSKNVSGKEMEMNIILPYIDFTSSQFLGIYYDIHSFEDAIDWISKQKHLVALRTQQRIIECALSAYGETMKIIDPQLVAFFIDVAKKNWIYNIYLKINKYIEVDDDKVSMVSPTLNKLSTKDEIVSRTNYIISTFLTTEIMLKFLTKYFDKCQPKWNDCSFTFEKIQIDFIDYIENKIKKTVNE